jgi:CheY-like chemotaxis protein
VRGDDRKLRQVLINLLGNAVKFTDSGTITMRVMQQHGVLYAFSVEDTGPGITAEARQRIFQPFQQAEEGSAKGGTGLGLAISKSHIELMGGKLSLESAPGHGTRFSFTLELPIAESAPEETGDARHQPLVLAPGQRVRALVVDDVEDNREVLSGLLTQAGVDVTTAENGAEALQAVAEESPDIIFMDIRMPVMDGLTAVRRLREQWRKQPIVCIAITASGLLRQKSYYLAAGFDDFIGKPFIFEAICECIAKHLGVELQRQVSSQPSTGEAVEQGNLQLPEPMRQRLLVAARINAVTEIEAVIAELEALDPRLRVFAEHVKTLLESYDTDGIVALVDGAPPEPEAGRSDG